MRDPELVARAQHAAARLESAWERWRALQGMGETPAQPVVGYVGYALKEPWGQPRAVIGFSAEEAERLADFLERGSGDYGTAGRAALDRGAPERGTPGQRVAELSIELMQRHLPDQPTTALLPVAPAAESDILAVTSQLSGSQLRHSFLPGSGARLETQGTDNRAVLVQDVWARDGQAPARAQTLQVSWMSDSAPERRAPRRLGVAGRCCVEPATVSDDSG